MTLRAALALLCLAGGLASTPAAQAGAYPDKPVTLLIPYPPGGSTDILARPLSNILQKRWGQALVLEYRPGAGGTIATSQLARAKPDGYTLIMVLAAHAINPSMYASLPYDTKKDFAPVSLVATLPMIAVAPPSTPANTMQELIAYAKQNPGKLTFASAGTGNTSHLAGEMFKAATGINMVHVPYKGSAPAVVALLGGEVSLMFDSFSTSYPQVKAGKLKALAVTGEKRVDIAPDIPTVGESAVPGFVVNGWYGVLAPAGTPPDIVGKLSADIADALKTPSLREQIASYGYVPVGSTPADFSKYIDDEIVHWGAAVKASGARVE